MERLAPSSSDGGRTRAVVIGASLAGLGAARVLLDHFAEVVLLERDHLPTEATFRTGVAHGRQYHILLKRGELLYEELFPGLIDELTALGAPRITWGKGDVRWHHTGGWKRPHDTGLTTLACSRPRFEHVIRERLRENPRVRIVDRSVVRELLTDPEKRRATGVRIERRRDDGPPVIETLAGAFVVDASGRDSKAPAWLSALGLPAPEEVCVDASMAYASRLYRPAAGDRPWRGLIIHPTYPDRRQGALFPNETGLWHVTVSGFSGDHPPTDEAGFLAFMKSLDAPDIHEALRDAEPVSRIYGFRRTENRLRRYDRVSRHLEGFIVVGDAVCALNPIYGHGMSTAAMAATLLARELRRQPSGALAPGFGKSFQAKLGKDLALPWMAATMADAPYASFPAMGPFMRGALRIAMRYANRLNRLSVHDSSVYEALLHVGHLLRAPSSLFQPAMLLRALGWFHRSPQLERGATD